mmetsp:Transcript_66335/g.119391  ORF Transcript_66335/g.119391 Transcript_66335/m.119391 type:complete len:362 (-) Transcript_66335:44-1129(-)
MADSKVCVAILGMMMAVTPVVGDMNFVLPTALRAQPSRQVTALTAASPAGGPGVSPGGGVFGTGSFAVPCAVALALTSVLASRSRSRRSQVARKNNGSNSMWERKWWSVEETRDPTTLPVWQRDYRFGFQVLKRSMVENRKVGKKVFWDVRVLESFESGCDIEMLNSGLMGFIPRGEEGLGEERMAVGEIYKVECVACPQARVNKESKSSPWPNEPRKFKAKPIFSHYMWLEQQRSIEKAKELKAGDIVSGVIYKKCPKGLIVTLEGEHKPKGMLAMMDVSRKMTPHAYAAKMFPPGTTIKCYVIHSDTKNGRITLSTKEFEDDAHVGWMLSFPERCFVNADQAVEKYNEKRSAYIQWLQR